MTWALPRTFETLTCQASTGNAARLLRARRRRPRWRQSVRTRTASCLCRLLRPGRSLSYCSKHRRALSVPPTAKAMGTFAPPRPRMRRSQPGKGYSRLLPTPAPSTSTLRQRALQTGRLGRCGCCADRGTRPPPAGAWTSRRLWPGTSPARSATSLPTSCAVHSSRTHRGPWTPTFARRWRPSRSTPRVVCTGAMDRAASRASSAVILARPHNPAATRAPCSLPSSTRHAAAAGAVGFSAQPSQPVCGQASACARLQRQR